MTRNLAIHVPASHENWGLYDPREYPNGELYCCAVCFRQYDSHGVAAQFCDRCRFSPLRVLG